MASDFSVRLRTLRETRCLTQAELASMLAVSLVTMNRWERGHVRPRADHLEAIAELERGEKSSTRVPAPLPLPATSFVGRQRDLQSLSDLLVAERLVVITGPGGCGKTRLALEVAHRIAGAVCLVELGGLRDATLVPVSIAAAAGFPDQRSVMDTERLVELIGDRQFLLILDNCEHLIDTAAEFAERALRRCPNVSMLATSRISMGVRGEVVWPVAPLSTVPRNSDDDGAGGCEAVDLFAARARACDPSFAVTRENAADVTRVCAMLDGLPLAIEMAATLVPVLSPADLEQRLRERLELANPAAQSLVAHHSSLEATIQWSLDLLSPDDRRLFACLSVFEAEFDIAAAAAVCGEGETSILAALRRLVQASVVDRVRRGPEVRFRLLETLRRFGRRRLTELAQEEAVGGRHARYHLGLAVGADEEASSSAQAATLERIGQSQPDLRAALEWLSEHDTAGFGGMALALWRFWFTAGDLNEGRRWYDRVVSSRGVSDLTRCRARNRAGAIAHQQGDLDAASDLFRSALGLARETGHRSGEMAALAGAGMVEFERAAYRDARRYLEEAGEIAQELKKGWHVRVYFSQAACAAALRGDNDQARALVDLAESANVFSSDPQSLGIHAHAVGLLEFLNGDARVARTRYESALAAFSLINYGWGMAMSLDALGHLNRRERRRPEAKAAFSRALLVRTERGLRHGVAESVSGLALVASDAGDHELFARLMGATAGLGSTSAEVTRSALSDDLERAGARSRDRLGADRYDALCREGRHLDVAAVLVLAGPPEAAPGDGLRRATTPGRLTARELDVLAFITRGKTNREIADAIVLSPRTVEAHVQRICRKLGVRGRAEASARAVREGLV
jgi:predicted ATPase/DNA-binding CsgD family transcriptional regulator/DNA-binding XRE family transcriptional regulator